MRPLKKLTKETAEEPFAARIAWLEERRKEYRAARELQDPKAVKRYLDDYSDPIIKLALRSETFDKCAYCEARYTDVAFGDVEHILPKSTDPERLLNYDNLTIACGQCNVSKLNKEPPKYRFLNPFIEEDNPDSFIAAVGPMLEPVDDLGDGTILARANQTITELKLNRPGLLESRTAVLRDKCAVLVRMYKKRYCEGEVDFTRQKIEELKRADAEFSLVARTYFDQKRVP